MVSKIMKRAERELREKVLRRGDRNCQKNMKRENINCQILLKGKSEIVKKYEKRRYEFSSAMKRGDMNCQKV